MNWWHWVVNLRRGDRAMSSIQENKRIARRFLELVGEHKVEELCEMIAPTWTMHGGPPGLPPGPDGLRELFGTFGRIEQKWTIEDVIAEGDKVAVRATNSCLQESFLGIPAHGRWQTFTATFIHCIADGKILETWRNADDLGRVLQLGARIEPAASQQEQQRRP
jgi:predicted SnoaL-like aldol condensation-catalyzing enzyme